MSDIREAAATDVAVLRELAAEARWRDRRERIATAVLAGIVAHHGETKDLVSRATAAVAYADALIAELDKQKEVKP